MYIYHGVLACIKYNIFQVIGSEWFPEKVCLSCVKQLQEIGIFMEKCKTSYSLFLKCMGMKHQNVAEKGHENSNDSEGFHYDIEPIEKVIEEPHFQCAKCTKIFSHKKHLKLHIKGHLKMQPYSCPDCNLSFKYKQNILQHRVLHNNPTLYKCHICAQSKFYILLILKF